MKVLTCFVCVFALRVQSVPLSDTYLTTGGNDEDKKDFYFADGQTDEQEDVSTVQFIRQPTKYIDTIQSSNPDLKSSLSGKDFELVETNNILGSRNYVGLNKEESKENLEFLNKGISSEHGTLKKSLSVDLENPNSKTSPSSSRPPTPPTSAPTNVPTPFSSEITSKGDSPITSPSKGDNPITSPSVTTTTKVELKEAPRREDRSLREDEMPPEERENLCKCLRKGPEDQCTGEVLIPLGMVYIVDGNTYKMEVEESRGETEMDPYLVMESDSQDPEKTLESSDPVLIVSTGPNMKTLNVKNARSFQVCTEGLSRRLTTVSISGVDRVSLKSGLVTKRRKYPLTFELENVQEDLEITSDVFYSAVDNYTLNLKLSDMKSNNVLVDLVSPSDAELFVSVHNLNSIIFPSSMTSPALEKPENLLKSAEPILVSPLAHPPVHIKIDSTKNVDLGRQDAEWTHATFYNITNLIVRPSVFSHSKTAFLDFQNIANLTLEEGAISISGYNLSFSDVGFEEVREGGITGHAEIENRLRTSVVFKRTVFRHLHEMSLNFTADILHFSDVTFDFVDNPPEENQTLAYIEANKLYYNFSSTSSSKSSSSLPPSSSSNVSSPSTESSSSSSSSSSTSKEEETLPRGIILCEWRGPVRLANEHMHPEDAHLCALPTTTTPTTSTSTTTSTTTTIPETTTTTSTTTPSPPPPTTTTTTTTTTTISTTPPTTTVVSTTAQLSTTGSTDLLQRSGSIGDGGKTEVLGSAKYKTEEIGKILLYLTIAFVVLGVFVLVFTVAWYMRIQHRTYSWTPRTQCGRTSSSQPHFAFNNIEEAEKNEGTSDGTDGGSAEGERPEDGERAELMPRSSPSPAVLKQGVILRNKLEPTLARHNNSFIMDEEQSNPSCSGSRPLTPVGVAILQESQTTKNESSEEVTSQEEMTSHSSSSCFASSHDTSTLDLYV